MEDLNPPPHSRTSYLLHHGLNPPPHPLLYFTRPRSTPHPHPSIDVEAITIASFAAADGLTPNPGS